MFEKENPNKIARIPLMREQHTRGCGENGASWILQTPTTELKWNLHFTMIIDLSFTMQVKIISSPFTVLAYDEDDICSYIPPPPHVMLFFSYYHIHLA